MEKYENLAKALATFVKDLIPFKVELEDLEQDAYLFLLENPSLITQYSDHPQFLLRAFKNNLLDNTNKHTSVVVPKPRQTNSEKTKSMKQSASLRGCDLEAANEISSSIDVVFEQQLRLSRELLVSTWMSERAPILSYYYNKHHLDTEVPEPYAWRISKETRAYLAKLELSELIAALNIELSAEQLRAAHQTVYADLLYSSNGPKNRYKDNSMRQRLH